jgi:multicomponent Na+:H+ antiporter subunit A
MVKAGVVLLARMAPILSDSGVWRWWVVLAGGATMILGGYSALRQTDAKLLLAHSTVSQLGLLVILMGIGSPLATFAGVAHLLAHAVFKMGLFLGVGVIDHELGTREIDKIAVARKRLPLTVAAIGLGSLSMAGVIPLFGFVTKEKALVALLEAELGSASSVALVLVVVGSVLSVAYSVRLMRAFFGSIDDAAHSDHHGSWLARVLLEAPVALAGIASLGFGFLATRVGKWLVAPSTSLDGEAKSKLLLWPGVNTAFLISVAVVAVGAVVGMSVPLGVRSTARSIGERAFDGWYDVTLVLAKRVTKVTQSGSLPMYVGITSAVVGAAVITGLVGGDWRLADVVIAESPLELLVVALTVIFSVGVMFVRVRFTAAFLLGGVGLGIGVIFALRGAPDLAVTQLLVETLTIVIFLIALRAMPKVFAPSSQWTPKTLRVLLSITIGVVIPLFVLATRASRTAESVSGEYLARSLDEAGGRNVVNVILVDFRGMDTLGEIVVLAVAALGVANLVRVAERMRRERAAGSVQR